PVQVGRDSVHFLRDAITDLTRGMETYRDLARRTEAVLDESRASRPLATVGTVSGAEEADLHALAMAARRALESDRDKDIDYLVDNAPRALDRALDGLARVATIVRSMKQFAHPDQKDMCAVDINEGICSTLVIASNEYKYVADVETDLAELPPVVCHGGDINQVVLNLVINAAHAIAEKAQVSGERGRIRLATRRDGGFVTISVTDTGTGIPKAMHERVFEPFFTTKAVGRGTGQGLSIARATVVEKHRGELWFETEEGVGTTFFVRLPMHGDTAPAALAVRPSGDAMDDRREAA
ncbi:MAG: HAMP domain-containing histidine kinase, partial [Deltaproteobacteria bacterium]|nr:HAMP domain-containing histidine kinase [Deltaproteobacteria bacterium]